MRLGYCFFLFPFPEVNLQECLLQQKLDIQVLSSVIGQLGRWTNKKHGFLRMIYGGVNMFIYGDIDWYVTVHIVHNMILYIDYLFISHMILLVCKSYVSHFFLYIG